MSSMLHPYSQTYPASGIHFTFQLHPTGTAYFDEIVEDAISHILGEHTTLPITEKIQLQ